MEELVSIYETGEYVQLSEAHPRSYTPLSIVSGSVWKVSGTNYRLDINPVTGLLELYNNNDEVVWGLSINNGAMLLPILDNHPSETPPTGYLFVYIYASTWYTKDENDNIVALGGGGGGATTIGALTDVTNNLPANRDALLYNGAGQYVNRPIEEADISNLQAYLTVVNLSTHSVTELSDVTNAGSGAIITGAERTDIGNNKTHAAVVSGNPHAVTKSEVGLGNVDNTSDATKNAATVSLTNKTIDADLNTISNIDNSEIKGGAAIDATKIADGSVSNAEFQYLDGVTSDIQTQLDNVDTITTIVYNETGVTLTKGTAVYIQSWDAAENKISVAKASNDSASTMPAIGVVNSDITNLTSGTIVRLGRIDGINTLTTSVNDVFYVGTSGLLTPDRPTGATDNIQGLGRVVEVGASGKIDIFGAGRVNDVPNKIDAAKIGGGLVSDTEYDYLNGVTSAIQTQLTGKAASSHTHTHADITDYDTELAGKTNTTAFTPTADYHVATKKYVDDAVVGGGGYTDEQAQDAVGNILTDTATIDFTYDDVANTIEAAVIPEFADNVFRIQDDVDATKEIAFEASGVATATTQTITMPNHAVDLGNLGTNSFAAGSVTTGVLAADCVTGDKIADNAIGSEHLKSGSVGASEIASGAVNTAELADDAVTNAKIAAGAVTATEIDDDRNTEQIDIFIEEPENKTYVLRLNARYAFNVIHMYGKTTSGTITAAVEKESATNLVSATALSSTEADAASGGTKAVAIGETLKLVLTSNSTAVDLQVSIEILRT